jgi:hypothetical protein
MTKMTKNFNFRRQQGPQSGTGLKTGLAHWGHDVVGLVRWLGDEYQARAALAEQRRALGHMPAWQLDELGLSRDEVMAEAARPVWLAVSPRAHRQRSKPRQAPDCGCACRSSAASPPPLSMRPAVRVT